ncbi:MAG: hypothetical protein ACAH80_16260 [Alphaproteobacteria bacterium]
MKPASEAFRLLKNKMTARNRILQLDEKLKAAEKLEETGEKLLAHADLRQELASIKWQRKYNFTHFYLMSTLLLYAPVIIAPAAVVFCAVIALLFLLAFSELAAESFAKKGATAKVLGDIDDKVESTIASLLGREPLSYSASPRFEDVMTAFPQLKEKFILAAARESVTPPLSPAAGTRANKGMEMSK